MLQRDSDDRCFEHELHIRLQHHSLSEMVARGFAPVALFGGCGAAVSKITIRKRDAEGLLLQMRDLLVS
jgi:hypothetical protein